MLRHELRQAANNVLQVLVKSQLAEALSGAGHSDTATGSLLTAARTYGRLTAGFGDSEAKVLKAMRLTALETDEWVPLRGSEGDRAKAMGLLRSVTLAQNFLPRVLDLLDSTGASESPSDADETSLSVTLMEEGREVSSPARIGELMEAIAGLYDVAAAVTQVDSRTVGVLACDSGSDKLFTFTGLAKAIAVVKRIIVSYWERIAYLEEGRLSARLDNVAKSLPIIQTLDEMREVLGAENCELMKRKLADSVIKFAEVGAVTPEIDHRARVSPRLLMQPARKLLVARTGEGEGTDDGAGSGGPRRPQDADMDQRIRDLVDEQLRKRQEGEARRDDPTGDDIES